MGKLIVIRLGEGSFKEGFPVVNLQIAEDGKPSHHQPDSTSLPADPELHKFYESLNNCYEEFKKNNYDYFSLSDLYSQYNLSSDHFKEIVSKWLNSSDFHNKWYHQICPYFSNKDNIRVVWQIKDQKLAKLPWHLWNFFENYPFAEIAFSLSEYEVKECYHLLNREVRILVIDGGGVDSKEDIEEIKKLSPNPHILEQEEVKTICKTLEEEEWDILFFIGHSKTSDNKGILKINGQDKVAIDNFKTAVNKALGKRLRLAIFNSCDGLVLATTLASWNFPQVIVMRLPISDLDAHSFMHSFIPAFKQGKTLYLALREARDNLEQLEKNGSPKSILQSWLPVIYDQAFVQKPLTWQSLPMTREKPPEPPYIERPPLEQTCYDAIVKPGGLIRIKAPQKMGKTSLLDKILDYAKSKGYKTVNLQFSDPKFLENYETCFKTFCSNVSVNLNIEDKTNEYWTTYQTSDSFTAAKFYFQNYLLSTIETNLVIGLNHFEIFFKNRKVFERFCALLRDFHDFGKSTDEIGQIWRKLRIVIVNSTEKYPELNINHSPFNVGVDINERIGLRPFTETEAKKLLDHYQLEQKLNEQDFKSLITLVGGHPYLIQQAFAYLKKYKEHTIYELFETASTEQGEVFIEHLRKLLNSLEENDLKESYKKVLTESNVKLDSTVGFKLHSLGLIKFSGNYAISSCDLYTKYFSEYLVDKQTKIGGNND